MKGKVSFIPVEHDPWADLPKGPTELRQGPMSFRDYLPFVGEAVKQLLTEKVKRGAEALALPGNVLQGNVDPNSPEGFAAAMTLSGMLPVGGIGFAEPSAAGIFGGRLAQTADRAALARAQDMEAHGLPQRSIWDDTGWWRGLDGEWRFEIPDTAAAYTPPVLNNFPRGADKRLAHPELFEAYPNLKHIGVAEDPGLEAQGFHGINYGPRIDLNPNLTPEHKLSTLLHEMQHSIQDIEGFQPGANPVEFEDLPSLFPSLANIDKLNLAALVKQKMLQRPDLAPEEILPKGMLPKETVDEIKRLVERAPQNKLLELAQKFSRTLPANPRQAYARTVGEVEARNVQRRADLAKLHGTDFYKNVPAWETMDVHPNAQIFRTPEKTFTVSPRR